MKEQIRAFFKPRKKTQYNTKHQSNQNTININTRKKNTGAEKENA